MTGYREHSSAALRNSQGFSLLEIMTVVAILGILATIAFPSMRRMMDRQTAKASATQVAGLLSDARTRAVSEGTPHLVYFNPAAVDANGDCATMAVEVRDSDHSYSLTPGDQTREFKLADNACTRVKPVGETAGAASSEIATVPLPADDLATRAPDAAAVGIVPAVTSATTGAVGAVVGGLTGSGSSGSGSSGSGSSSSQGEDGSGSMAAVATDGTPTLAPRSATIAQTVVNGTTFPVDANGSPVIAFSERGVAVDPANPTAWGSGAGGVYLTDGDSVVVAAVVAPLGDVQLRVFDTGSGSWK